MHRPGVVLDNNIVPPTPMLYKSSARQNICPVVAVNVTVCCKRRYVRQSIHTMWRMEMKLKQSARSPRSSMTLIRFSQDLFQALLIHHVDLHASRRWFPHWSEARYRTGLVDPRASTAKQHR